MTQDELIRKIKNIKKIEPSQAWIFSNKAFIFDYIQAQEKKESQLFGIYPSPLSFIGKVNLFARSYGVRFLVPAISALTIVFTAGGFVLAKSQDALPGDALYSVKIFAEKVEVAMTLNEEKRATLNFDLAEKRLNEISQLTENSGGKNVSGPDVDVAMENFNNHLNAAVSDMSNVIKSDSSADKAVAVAKIANNKTSDYVKKIAKAKDVIDSKSDSSSIAKDQIVETIKKIEEVNFNALTVLASLGSEVTAKVEEKISEAAAKNDLVKQKILAIDRNSVNESDAKLASDLAKQASDNLIEAQKYLAGNDSAKALEKIVASNDMIGTAEKIADASVSVAEATPSVSPLVSVSPKISPEPSLSPEVSPKPSLAPSVSPDPSPKATDGTAEVLPEPSLNLLPEVSPSPTVLPIPTATPEASLIPKSAL